MDASGSLTAKLCLFARAAHASEEQPVFNDYTAGPFIGKEEYQKISKLIENDYNIPLSEKKEEKYDQRKICRQVDCYLSPILMPRLAFAEENLQVFAQKHGKIQYVILGAGMETFAFRNQNPDIQIYELDHPYTQNFKKKRIQELGWKVPANVHYAPIDFSKDSLSDVLENIGFQKENPSYFSILGVTYYLHLSVFENTLKQVEQQSEKGDQIVFDFPDETSFTSSGFSRAKRLSEITASMGETMTGGFSYEEIQSALDRSGLHVNKHMNPQEIEERWFRNNNMHAFPNVHLILAEK